MLRSLVFGRLMLLILNFQIAAEELKLDRVILTLSPSPPAATVATPPSTTSPAATPSTTSPATPPSTTSPAATPSTTSPAATPATSVVVNSVPAPTDRVVTTTKTKTLLGIPFHEAKTVIDKALPAPPSPTQGTTALLEFIRDKIPGREKKYTFKLDINSSATLEAIRVDLRGNDGALLPVSSVSLNSRPSRIPVDNNNNNDTTTITSSFVNVTLAGTLTIEFTVPREQTGKLTVTVPDKSVVAGPLTYLLETQRKEAAETGKAPSETGSLQRQIMVVNTSPVLWKCGTGQDGIKLLVLDSTGKVALKGKMEQIKKADSMPLRPISRVPFPEKVTTHGYTAVELLDAIQVDAANHYVDLAGLVSASGTAAASNISGLPRVIRLKNLTDKVVIPSGTPIQIHLADGTFGTATLAADLVPGIHPGVDVSKLMPSEYFANIAYLSVGIDPSLSIEGAKKGAADTPWLPLSVGNGKLNYLNAVEWNFKQISPNVQFFDSTPGSVVQRVTSPAIGANPAIDKVWSVSMAPQTLPSDSGPPPTPDVLAKALTGLKANLTAVDTAFQSNPAILPNFPLFFNSLPPPGTAPAGQTAPAYDVEYVVSKLKPALAEAFSAASAYASSSSQNQILEKQLAGLDQRERHIEPFAGRNAAGIVRSRISHDIEDLHLQVVNLEPIIHAASHEMYDALSKATTAQ